MQPVELGNSFVSIISPRHFHLVTMEQGVNSSDSATLRLHRDTNALLLLRGLAAKSVLGLQLIPLAVTSQIRMRLPSLGARCPPSSHANADTGACQHICNGHLLRAGRRPTPHSFIKQMNISSNLA